jgi:hypothetical protein
MAFDFDLRPERSDFQGLFGLAPGAGRDAARAGVQAAGASLLGIDRNPPRLEVEDSDGGGDGLEKWLLGGLIILGAAALLRR